MEIVFYATVDGYGYQATVIIPFYEFAWGYIGGLDGSNAIEFRFEIMTDALVFMIWYVDFDGYTAENFYMYLARITLLIGGDE